MSYQACFLPSESSDRQGLKRLSRYCRQPFRKPDGWLLWSLLGIAAAPFLVSLILTVSTSAGYTVSCCLRWLPINFHFCKSWVHLLHRGGLHCPVACLSTIAKSLCCQLLHIRNGDQTCLNNKRAFRFRQASAMKLLVHMPSLDTTEEEGSC